MADPGEPAFSGAEVRRRASRGALLLALRGIAIRGIGFVGSLVLARLLTPEDFGTVAFGTTLVVAVGLFTQAGIGASMLRRAEAPTRAELRALGGLQLVITATTVAIAAGALLVLDLGRPGEVVLVMLASLPITALRTPASIGLERNLSYSALTRVEVGEVLVFYGWAIAAVALGGGVMGFASAAIPRAIFGTVAMVLASPTGLVLPHFSLAPLRGMLGFGAKFQAVQLVHLGREQGLNVTIAAVGGLATLGIWSLGYRLLQVTFLVLESLARVSYPAMARLINAGEDPRPLMERAAGMAGVGMALLAVTTVAPSPAYVPLLFGDRWSEVAEILPWAVMGILISGPVSVGVSGYLLAVGEAGTVLRSVAVGAVTWIAGTIVLVPLAGAPGVGMAWVVAALAESNVLRRRAVRRSGARVLQAVYPSAAAAILGGWLGWAIADRMGADVGSLVLALAAGQATCLAIILLARRAMARDLLALLVRTVRRQPAPSVT
jgi:O-antigen/teichoic acid export membrane protein